MATEIATKIFLVSKYYVLPIDLTTKINLIL